MVRLSKIIKGSPKSRKEQLKKKEKLFERGHSYQKIFKEFRDDLDSTLMNMEISEEETKIFSLNKIAAEQSKERLANIKKTQKQLRDQTIGIVLRTLKNALDANEVFNKEVRKFISDSSLDPFDFVEFWDMVMRDFIEIYIKGLPEYILTSKLLNDFWGQKLSERVRQRGQNGVKV